MRGITLALLGIGIILDTRSTEELADLKAAVYFVLFGAAVGCVILGV